MLNIIKDINEYELKGELWSGAIDTLDVIIENGKLQDLIFLLQELYQEPVNITTINDLLWFEDDFIYEQLHIVVDDYDCIMKL